MGDHAEPTCVDCKHPIGTLVHILTCGSEDGAMNIKMADSMEEALEKLSNVSLFAEVKEVQVNQGVQFLIEIKGQYKGEDVNRTFMFPCPSFPDKTLGEIRDLRVQVLTGYLEAVGEILNSEHEEKP